MLGSVVVKRSNRLIILLGVLLAIAGGLAAIALANGSGVNGGNGGNATASPTPTPEPTVTVVVAKVAINLGDTITASMVGVQTLTVSQRDALGQDTFSSVDQVIGKIAGGTITAGQVLMASRDILSPGSMPDGTDIAGAISPGMVAVSMEVDQTNGVGTLIVPGDHVDIILSVYTDPLAISGKDAAGNTISLPGVSQVTSKMVIQDGKILATLVQPAAPTAAPVENGTPAVAPAATSAIVQFTGRTMIAIVEVTPDEAEIIRYAQRAETEGTQNYIDLAFALRSSQDNSAPPVVTPGITFKMLVDKYGVLPPDPRGVIPADLAKSIQW
jgi:Flp pilus assembly protein CpaB